MTKHEPINISVERVISSHPESIYHLLADVTRMSEFSPEVQRVEWLDGATHAAVGTRFTGHNRLGPNTWSTKPVITVTEPGRTFAFEVPGKVGATWRFDLSEVDGGTRLVQSVAQKNPTPWIIRMLQRRAGVTDRAANLRDAMHTTLERIAQTAEAGAPQRSASRAG